MLGMLAVSTRWTRLPLTLGFVLVNVALILFWAELVIVAFLKFGKRGLWMLIGAPLVMWYPLGLALLYWACEHGANC